MDGQHLTSLVENHEEALLLAQLKAEESNLARCYLSLNSEVMRLTKALEQIAENNADTIARNRDKGWGTENRRKTTCKNGHPFEGDNLVIRKQGWRSCRACLNAATQRWKERA